jgi:large subunit ribosomal protein L30
MNAGGEARMVKLTLRRSPIGCTQRQRQTLKALGLTRVGKTVIVQDSDPNRGRIQAVGHLIEVEG